MNHTSARFTDFERDQAHRTWGHRFRDGSWHHYEQRMPHAQSPAGGVTSSAADLIPWMRLHLDGTPWLSPTHRPYTGTHGYALGWNAELASSDIGAPVLRLSHSGAFVLGASTCVSLWPQEGLGIVALTNVEPMAVPETLCLALRLLLDDPTLDAVRLLEEPSVRKPPAPPLRCRSTSGFAPLCGRICSRLVGTMWCRLHAAR